MNNITMKIILEEIKWARQKNSGVLEIDGEKMIDDIETAIEKQIPKKIIETPAFQSYYSAGDESETLCPNCENELEIENQTKYCCECGQKLDWSDFE